MLSMIYQTAMKRSSHSSLVLMSYSNSVLFQKFILQTGNPYTKKKVVATNKIAWPIAFYGFLYL